MTHLSLAAVGKNASLNENGSQLARILCVLFFFSGFPALIYQLIWQRALFRIFGVNIESVTIVVTAFMLGLGFGSLIGGALSKRRLPLLPLLAAIELMTGAFGLVSLGLFDRVGILAAGLPLPLTAAVSLGLVAVPTLLMGATLPLLVAHFVRQSRNVGSSVGLLYYVNTLGAGAACLVSTVLLFPYLGMQGSIRVAVAINVVVACGALIAYRRDRVSSSAEASPSVAPYCDAATVPALRFGAVLALAGAGGFVSLSYEIFFFRTVSFATGSSASAFALTLGAFLVGLASGSREASTICRQTVDRAIRRMLRDVIIANLLGFLFLPLLGHLTWLGPGVLGVALLMVYLVARHWGSLLPCLAHLGIAADSRAGMRTALLYLANIIGSASGSILVGFILMDHLGLVGLAVLLGVLGLACVVLLALATPLPRRAKRIRIGAAVGLAVIGALALPSFTTDLFDRLLHKGSAEAGPPLVRILENRSGIVTVDESGAVFGNGMYDGRFNTDLNHDVNGVLRPYALSLFHPAPRDVLMIGLSSGSWAQVLANNPEVASLTVIEINPGYLRLIQDTPAVASVLHNPKVMVITDDGRRWLRLNPDRRFDAVVSNTTYYFRANVSNLLSVEFLDLVKAHLKPDGIFFYNTTGSTRVQRTACLSFPYGARFTNHMVVSPSPIAWNFKRWRQTLENYRIDGRALVDPVRAEDRDTLENLMGMEADLVPGAAETLTKRIEPCAEILARSTGQTMITDDNMGSEWRHFLSLD
jgi:spermidine synthase